MFTPSELYSIARTCPKELESLLNEVGLSMPETTEDLDVYMQLDDELTQRTCEVLKCTQPVGGYCHLLDLAKVPYSYSETSKELIAKIVANSNQIRVAATSPRTIK